ncbi:uracil-DNA glycosylase [Methanogenium marinum]|uniref:Type-4 uracil-DNA glycosylase n=1 Tax=Methanogenium marinum TaxID=348610 RepID=A0A9Q4KU14_9EURY|nr:uracil-DNA glycosylase [Methanogenium marinum]MDE4908821.1 uracil-DNA glycosylase [Methanogenium marinum]
MTTENERTKLDEAVRTCTRCPLAETRTNAVPGDGPVPTRILFIGEAPGRNEDTKGIPFVGRAGSILDGLLEGIGVARDEVFITNIVKCRPPKNRDPTNEEIEACRPYLERQLVLLCPEVIVPLGRFAMRWVLESYGITPGPISEVHGTVFRIHNTGCEQVIIPVYHPAATIYRPAFREVLAADFETIREVLEQSLIPGGAEK